MKKTVWTLLFLCGVCCLPGEVIANDLVKTVKQIKPSIVGIGTRSPMDWPKTKLYGTGFVVTDGLHIVTNKHVIPAELDFNEELIIFIGSGNRPEYRVAQLLSKSAGYDLAILKIDGKPLRPFKLAGDALVPEGSDIAFTGFPIGAILGLYPVTHQGIISSHTPIVTPVSGSGELDVAHIKRLKSPFLVYQLDATAYPGNSGSPVYDKKTGVVYGVLNRVFVKETKESVLEKPSGISYAIPVKFLNKMLKKIE
ncbi:serine protease [Psychrobium sp. 1_MG-2023]|uniref:S1 family peptidase n=1 Tax=Psychrobium sp. 1_MG-2023 TaxID=3062624 RepID=UPI000C33C860|nr:serine protease [Psychrobium sp. 1_MG-2023]MDP2561304.1 serine protease [Psychrobium sp. 1_MG-2023]PKF54120.1 serine protease [Alteromonadales bacterium alter-6D02]